MLHIDFSGSIQRQLYMVKRIIATDYISWKACSTLWQDDGYSGTNFNCPSWSKLLEKIEYGEVSTLIVKDASRLGRNYLKVCFYTKVLFVEKGVWFIAINNGIDSVNHQGSKGKRFAPCILSALLS